MDISELRLELLQLDDYEQLGKRYYRKYGCNMAFSQYLLLKMQTKDSVYTPESLNSASFKSQQAELEQKFKEKYHPAGLREEDFINSERNIEIEKLLRYIDIPKHKHNFMEFVYILSGTCLHTIGEQCYEQQAGAFTIVPSYSEHELRPSEDCLCLTVKIRSEEFIRYEMPNMPYFAAPTSFFCGNDNFIPRTLLEIYYQQESGALYCDRLISHLFQSAVIYCMQNYSDTMQILYNGPLFEGKMLEIINYMFENYQTVTLKSLAKHLGYSESYTCKLFRTYADATFSQIIKAFKLEQAKKMLETTDMKVQDICEAIGYSDVTTFIREFKKKFEITPAKYRKAISESK